jgi:hypothetical protein
MIEMLDCQGNSLLRIEAERSESEVQVRRIEEHEELLGFYGTVRDGFVLDCLGFIVW